MRLLCPSSDAGSQMLFNRSITWLWKITNWWCDSGGEISV